MPLLLLLLAQPWMQAVSSCATALASAREMRAMMNTVLMVAGYYYALMFNVCVDDGGGSSWSKTTYSYHVSRVEDAATHMDAVVDGGRDLPFRLVSAASLWT